MVVVRSALQPVEVVRERAAAASRPTGMKTLLATLALVTLVTLAACGGDDGGGTATDPGGTGWAATRCRRSRPRRRARCTRVAWPP